MFTSINPYNQQKLKTYRLDSVAAVERKLKKADRAFANWSALSLQERTDYLRKVGDYLVANKQRYGELMTAEMGKTLREAIVEVEKCAATCTFYADHSQAFLADQRIETDRSDGPSQSSFVTYQPLGAVLAIMPWNYPFWQVMRFAIPGLIAGNVGLLKHAPNVSGCSLVIEELFSGVWFARRCFSIASGRYSDCRNFAKRPASQGRYAHGQWTSGIICSVNCGPGNQEIGARIRWI
jgi:succinate-semialdehyde dehydrogenase/glutarate-semialdehyde dehydrogenase